MGELRVPVEAWGLCGSFHVHVLLLAKQLAQLRLEQGVHSHAGRPVRRALVVGHVVDVTETRKFLRFAVDDGSGCALCLLWNTQDEENAAERNAAMYMPSLGDLVRVKGKVVTYCGQQQLTVTCCEPVTDANEELLHWLDAAALAEHG